MVDLVSVHSIKEREKNSLEKQWLTSMMYDSAFSVCSNIYNDNKMSGNGNCTVIIQAFTSWMLVQFTPDVMKLQGTREKCSMHPKFNTTDRKSN